MENIHNHKWAYCDHCSVDTVYCGKCGNNTCNGGYGILPDGSDCDVCEDAYKFEQITTLPPLKDN